jgi:hypothetical protein
MQLKCFQLSPYYRYQYLPLCSSKTGTFHPNPTRRLRGEVLWPRLAREDPKYQYRMKQYQYPASQLHQVTKINAVRSLVAVLDDDWTLQRAYWRLPPTGFVRCEASTTCWYCYNCSDYSSARLVPWHSPKSRPSSSPVSLLPTFFRQVRSDDVKVVCTQCGTNGDSAMHRLEG